MLMSFAQRRIIWNLLIVKLQRVIRFSVSFEKLGVSHDATMAIGDQANDYSMIEQAGIGVAMGNAIPESNRRLRNSKQ